MARIEFIRSKLSNFSAHVYGVIVSHCAAVLRLRTVTSPLSRCDRTSVLFVSMSFILLLVISLAWLLFYYVQRFRYMHAKDRLAVRELPADLCCVLALTRTSER